MFLAKPPRVHENANQQQKLPNTAAAPLTALVHSPAALQSAMTVLYVCTSLETSRSHISRRRRIPSSSRPALAQAMMPALNTAVVTAVAGVVAVARGSASSCEGEGGYG